MATPPPGVLRRLPRHRAGGDASIDAKLAKRAPGAWARLAATTSILPFGAIAAGRNRLVLGEIGWVPPVVGLLAWAAMLHLHRSSSASRRC